MTARRLAPFAALAAVWAVFVAYAWPGLMTWDSVNQLLQARAGELGNWHPPIMAELWRALDAIVAGPALMLIVQTALFAIGLYGVMRRYAAPPPAALIAALVFAFPPVFAPLSTIWKDSLMAAVLLCGAAGWTSPSRAGRAAGWLALIAAAALRHNAPILIVPLTAMIVPYAPRWPIWRRRALGAALGLAISFAGVVVSRALTDRDEFPFANMIAMPDVAAIIAREGTMTDDQVRALVDGVALVGARDYQARLRAVQAEDTDWQPLTTGDDRVFDRITTPEQAAAMIRAWRRAIRAYPAAHLAHRFRLWTRCLGFNEVRSLPYITPSTQNADLLAMVGEVAEPSSFQRWMASRLRAISRSIVFWPMLYVVLGIGLLALLWRDPLQRGLLLGALGYEALLIIASPGGQEYRYSHWMITCVVIAAAVRLVGVRRAPDTRAHATVAPS